MNTVVVKKLLKRKWEMFLIRMIKIIFNFVVKFVNEVLIQKIHLCNIVEQKDISNKPLLLHN